MNERRKEPVTHEEARAIMSRFNASHWNLKSENARYSIPADPTRDDDLLMVQYIDEQQTKYAALLEAAKLLADQVKHQDLCYRLGKVTLRTQLIAAEEAVRSNPIARALIEGREL